MRPESEQESSTVAGPTGATGERLRRSPLTDPRALVLSLLIHVVLLATASVLAFQVAGTPGGLGSGRAIQGELEGTDNRAEPEPAGGSGEVEGRAADVSAEPGVPTSPTHSPAADALISDVLPVGDVAEPTSTPLPGPATSGLGMLQGTGSAEGVDQGTEPSGDGGRSGGPGTEFFGMRERAGSYAYVIDCSGSMTARGSLDVAKNELLTSLGKLAGDSKFAVVFYNLEARVVPDSGGQAGMMVASASNKARVRSLLSTIKPDGGTDHMQALKTAFQLHPEVVFFLTDADLMTRQDVAELVAQAGKIRVQAVEFGQVTGLGGSAPLKLLAKMTGGSYRYIDINSFRK